MHPSLARRCFLPVFLLLMLLLAPLTAPAADTVPAGTSPRSCSVKEVIKGGMYVYLRCQEKGTEIWLASVAREFKVDEVISFVDAPAMTNFFSKQLNRTFPEVIFTDILPPGVQRK